MSDPVSWLVIERGWDVVGADGSELGTVADVLGDQNDDIFNGISVGHGLLRQKSYVAAERVASIYEGRIELDLDAAAFEALDDDPPSSG